MKILVTVITNVDQQLQMLIVNEEYLMHAKIRLIGATRLP